ncbi:MAG: energy transducer TonB, partial [Alphaproteobacteria bacterium]
PEPKPEPEPAEPEPAEPEPEPKPEPAPEPKPEPEEEEEEEESKPEPEKPEPPKEEPPPEPKPEPAKEEPREEPEEADPFNQMASVLKDKDPDKQQERVFHEEGDAKPAGEFNVEGVGRQDGMTVSTVDALKYQISPCWSVDAGAKNAGELAIGMVIEFNPDGTLRPGVNNPRIKNQMRYATDSYFRAAADRAVMAVRECEGDGYKIPPGLSKLNVTFDPSEMVGGG